MNRVKTFIILGAFSLLILALPGVASAQWGGRNDDRYGNSGYGYSNLRGTIVSLQNRARSFERQIDIRDDRRDDRQGPWGRYGRNDRLDDLDRLATRFKNAAENLADEFGRGRNLGNSRDEAQRVLSLGSQIDQMIDNRRNDRRFGNRGGLEAQWRQIENDLRLIARAYNLSYSGRGGSLRDRIPFPLPY